MLIRFLENTNIRLEPRVSDDTLVGKIFAGRMVHVEDMPLPGDAIGSNNWWYRDANGWYYWSGRSEMVAANTPPEEGAAQHRFSENVIVAARLDTAFRHLNDGEKDNTAAGADIRNIRLPDTTAELPWGITYHQIPQRWWHDAGITGRGVRIAILSTGIDPDCPLLSGAVAAMHIVTGAGDTIEDVHGIGTQAAVLAAGRSNKMCGVAPEAAIIVVKIGEIDSIITPEAALEGLDQAIAAQADIIAVLVDFPLFNEAAITAMQQKIDKAIAQNIWVTAPVGTVSDRRPVVRYPAACKGVLSVGAHDNLEQRCAFSAKSEHLDLLVPGEGLRTMGPAFQVVDANTKSTAIATAFMAGVLALLRQEAVQNGASTEPSVIFEQLKLKAFSPREHIAKGQDVEYGFGLLRL